jgi:hypothetical protein
VRAAREPGEATDRAAPERPAPDLAAADRPAAERAVAVPERPAGGAS